MATVKVYNQQGEIVGEQNLNPAIFDVAVKPVVVQQVVVALQANRRRVVAATKDRSEVAGGGRKPWRQKGTGRARHGSIRSPLWRGGGVTFGPTSARNYSLKINKKAKRKVLAMVLSDKVADHKLMALDQLSLPEMKTKHVFEMLQNLKLRPTKIKKPASKSTSQSVKKTESNPAAQSSRGKSPSILLVLEEKNRTISNAARNIPRLASTTATSLNILDILQHHYLLAPTGALKKIETLFSNVQGEDK